MIINQFSSTRQRFLINNIVKTILNDEFFATDWRKRIFELEKVGSENQDLLKAKIINYFEQKSELELKYYDYNLFIRTQKSINLKLKAMVKNLVAAKLLLDLANKFKEIFYQWQLRLNPEKSLTLLEKNASQYSDWFDALGGYGRKLYRKALKINYTEPQKLDALLSLMQKDGWCVRRCSQQLLQIVEPKVFGDFIVKGSLRAEYLAEYLKNNLNLATLQANITLETQSYEQLDNNDQFISGIGEFVENLAVKINYQKIYLIGKATSLYDFTREIYVTMQSERIKLLHLWFMVEALAKGEIFSAISNVNKVGSLLEELKLSNEWGISDKKASEIILNIDGGHVQNIEKNKRSFEKFVSTAYRPEDLVEILAYKKEIKHKVSVTSAMKDGQKIIKKLTKNACLQLGMTKDTTIVALTDGAGNCWSIVEHITKDCKGVIKILDWFHIGKKFKERESKIPVELVEQYNSAKWKLWHGKFKDSLERLIKLKNNLIDEAAIKKIDELIFYINSNKEYIVNYQQRQDKYLPFTSKLAESSINSIINERQKNKKMQWSRSVAHNLLQIRTSIFSKGFDYDWNAVAGKMYREAA